MRLKFLVVLSCFVSFCLCQPQAIATDSLDITLCWEGYPSDSAVYLVYYRNISGDTTWKGLGFTKESQLIVSKGNKKSVAFGIRTVLFGDTSDLHTSLEADACVRGACAVQCEQVGAWYLDWKIKKPRGIRKNK